MIDLNTAELSVLGSILLTNGKILDELDLAPGDYHQPAHEFLHRTMAGMKLAGKPVDLVTVTGEVVASGERVDPTVLHKALDVTPSASNADYYAGIVAGAATRRRLALAGQKIHQLADGPGEPDEIVEAARKLVDDTQNGVRAQPVEFLADSIEGTINRIEEKVRIVPTVWPSMNRLLGGFRPGAVYVVGARPSVGKSVVALQAAQALLKAGSVAFVSLEMDKHDLTNRLMSNELRIPGKHFEHDELMTPAEWSRIGEWVKARVNRPLAIMDRTGATITDIKRFVRNVHRVKPLGGIVVDYLQLMTQPSTGGRVPRHEFVADMSRQLKVLAMDLDVPVVVLSQLNRSSESREDKMPGLHDLRESGAIEQDADVVILLHREIIGDTKNRMLMAVAKNRRGDTGALEFDFAGHYSTVYDPEGNIA